MKQKFNSQGLVSLERWHGRPILLAMGLMCAAFAVGCDDTGRSVPSADPVPSTVTLPRLLVVANDPLADSIRREWRARTGGELAVESMDATEWTAILAKGTPLVEVADAVIYPTGDLGTLAESGLILAAPDYVFARDSDGRDLLAESDILPRVRDVDIRWNGHWMAIPFSTAPLLLVYRADLLEQCGLTVPRTWPELHRCAQELDARFRAHELPTTISSIVVQPLAPGWAARSLLARVAALIRDPSRYSDVFELTTMQPQIASAPFVRSLEELMADQPLTASPDARLTPAAVYQAVRAGEAVLGIGCWPVRHHRPDADAPPPRLGFALLPGSRDRYLESEKDWIERRDVLQVPLLAAGGYVGSVVQGTRRQRLAWNLLRQLASPEWSQSLGPTGDEAAPFRQSQLADLRPWLGEELSDESVQQLREALQENFSAQVTMAVLRIPFSGEYLRVLDEAVLAALEGRATAREALQHAARQWSALVDQHGRTGQAEAYLRGLSIIDHE